MSGRSAVAVYGAIDLGSHNCRMLAAAPARSGIRVVDSFSRIVRLGEAVAARGLLDERAMDRAVEALKVCAERLRTDGVRRWRAVATAACRGAANRDIFINRVAAETGLALEIISPREEAHLTAAGCSALLEARPDHALVFDIGGGSTEIIWLAVGGEGFEVIDLLSLPEGVVSLAERFGGDRVTAKTYAAMVEHVRAQLAPFEAEHRIAKLIARGGAQMIGSCGTVTTLGAVHLGLRRYARTRVDGLEMAAPEIDAVARHLTGQSAAERAAHPCIGRDRADLVVAGCAVLEAIRGLWPAERLRIADRGLREGILIELMAADRRAQSAS